MTMVISYSQLWDWAGRAEPGHLHAWELPMRFWGLLVTIADDPWPLLLKTQLRAFTHAPIDVGVGLRVAYLSFVKLLPNRASIGKSCLSWLVCWSGRPEREREREREIFKHGCMYQSPRRW